MHYFEAILRVLFVGLVLGAGLPGLFAIGLRAYSAGLGGVAADGTVQRVNPALKFLGLALFVIVALVILAAILWITRNTISHHFGVNLFPFLPKK
jgi:hypothetical protein